MQPRHGDHEADSVVTAGVAATETTARAPPPSWHRDALTEAGGERTENTLVARPGSLR